MKRVRLALAFALMLVSYLLPWCLAEKLLYWAGRVTGVIPKSEPIHFVPTF